MSRSPEGQSHNVCLWKSLGLSSNVCEHEVNLLTDEKIIRGKWNFNVRHPYYIGWQSLQWMYVYKYVYIYRRHMVILNKT